LRDAGVKKVIFVGPVPRWTAELPQLILTRFWVYTPRRTYRGIDKNVMQANEKLQADFKPIDGVLLLDMFNFFCDAKGCLTYLGDDRKTGLVSYDYSHLTPTSSDYLGKNLLVYAITGKQQAK
jgi:hypothetical protein